MSDFEFFIGFFGLVMGLSVVEIIGGLARLADERRNIRVGFLTPILAAFLLLDMTAFWAHAWDVLREVKVTYVALLLCMAISSIYYVAASVVIPKDLKAWPDLDAYFLQRRRYVVGLMTVAGLLLYDVGTPLITGDVAAWKATWLDISQSWIGLLYYACVIGIWFSRNKWVNAGLLLLIIARYGILLLNNTWS
jgi:hypothetical protein